MIRPDHRQLDLFATPAPPPIVAAVLAPRARPAHAIAFEARLTAVREATARAKAAGGIERLAWGDPSMRWNKGGYVLELYEDGGQWFAREELALHNSGSTGPFWPARHMGVDLRTRDDVVLHHMRALLKSAATCMARPSGDDEARAKQFAKLAAWAIGQCPALIHGVDLVSEFAAMREAADAREDRRQIAYSAVHDLAERVQTVLRAIDVDAYGGGINGGLIQNKAVKNWPGKGEDAAGHAKAWPAEWAISGHAPDALAVTIYPRTGQIGSKTVSAAIAALTIALAEPVQTAPEDAPYPHGDWTWEDAA